MSEKISEVFKKFMHNERAKTVQFIEEHRIRLERLKEKKE